MLEHYLSHGELRALSAMVVPVWFAPEVPADDIRAMLRATLVDAEECVAPQRLAVIVDGAPLAAVVAAELQEEFGARAGAPFALRVLDENRGKGAAVAEGLEAFPEAAFVVVRDADGDHCMDDVPHLLRLAHQMADECDHPAVVVIGRRTSVHAPLGWVRGEFELLLNEIVLEALRYALARRERALPLHYCCAGQWPPDLQSGFKVYSREAARLAAASLRQAARESPELEMMRWGMELVPLVEVTLAGGVFGETHRMAYQEQPVTAYGTMDRPAAYAKKAVWALRRCAVAPDAARQMVDNALARRPLGTEPSGRQELYRFRSLVLQALGAADAPLRVPVFL